MYSTLKNSLLILMVLPCFCLGQEYDLLKELDSLDQNQDSFQLPAFKASSNWKFTIYKSD
jgi:hypothetical protein